MQGDNHYYENINGEKFEDKTLELFPKTPFGCMGIKVFDFDNDEDMDIYLSDMHSDMSKSSTVNNKKQKITIAWYQVIRILYF